MCRCMGRSMCRVLAAAIVVSMFCGVSVWADDLVPPSWRGTGLYTMQEWEFRAAGGPSAPDGTITTINPNGTPLMTPGADVIWTSDFGGTGMNGYIGQGGQNSFLVFSIPNYVDFEPFKLIRVQINGVWDPVTPPTVGPIFALDNELGPNVQVVFDGSQETFPGFHRWEDWRIFPNPDFEEIFIQLPGDSFVNQVVIETTSIPEPASLSLLALGGLGGGLIVVCRRRKSRRTDP